MIKENILLHFLLTLMFLVTSFDGVSTRMTIGATNCCWGVVLLDLQISSPHFWQINSLCNAKHSWQKNVYIVFLKFFTFLKFFHIILWLHVFILVWWLWRKWYVNKLSFSTFMSMVCKETFTIFSPWNASINS